MKFRNTGKLARSMLMSHIRSRLVRGKEHTQKGTIFKEIKPSHLKLEAALRPIRSKDTQNEAFKQELNVAQQKPFSRPNPKKKRSYMIQNNAS